MRDQYKEQLLVMTADRDSWRAMAQRLQHDLNVCLFGSLEDKLKLDPGVNLCVGKVGTGEL
jgi:hypothetical protein